MDGKKTQRAKIIFDNRNVPISARFDDPYYSFQDGLAESEYVFLGGNNIAERLRDGFHIGELGFGTGLNFFLTWRAWINLGINSRLNLGVNLEQAGKIHFTSFEAFPMDADDRARALAYFPELDEWLKRFEAFDGQYFEDDDVRLEVIHGDARKCLPKWKGMADAWYLDGFSPAKNPELWSQDLMQALYEHTKSGGTIATYSAAGFVRRNLERAGFQTQRIKGFAHKRHMTIALKD